MWLTDYFYVTADELSDDGKSLVIGELKEKKNGYMYAVHQELYKEKLQKFKYSSPIKEPRRALFYAGGAMEHHSLGRKFPLELPKANALIKSQSSVAAWSWAKFFGGVSFVSINANTCASSLYSIFEAFMAIKSGQIDEAIVVAEEWAEPLELMMFAQMGIEILPSDAFCVLRFHSSDIGGVEIKNISFRWREESSPFGVSKDGYKEIMALARGDSKIEGIKMHASGTDQNDKAELAAIIESGLDSAILLEYKSKIGHSQGVSAALEFAMMADSGEYRGEWLINAAGLGGFYGCAKADF